MTTSSDVGARIVPGRASEQAFHAVSALLFAVSAAVTVAWCASMSAMGEMSMPGGWTMSMAWMRMPGQTWTHAAVTFLGMWTVMMVAMMLPSLVPMLRRYREATAEADPARLGVLTAIAGAGYFFLWTVLGVAVFPVGVALATAEMREPSLSRAVPLAVGVVVGVMDLGVMAVVAAAIAAERLAGERDRRERVARGLGVLTVAFGLLAIARAIVVLVTAGP